MWWRRPKVLVGIVVAVLLGGVLVAVLARRSGPDPAPAATPLIHTGAEPAEQANITAVSTLLTGLPAAFAAGRKDMLTAAAAARFADVRAALPAGAQVTVHPDTWRRSGALGTVAITVRKPPDTPTSFVVVLTQEQAGWKVASTQQAA